MKDDPYCCDRCHAEARFASFDYCARCGKSLCPTCADAGCCGSLPMASGEAADGITPDLRRVAEHLNNLAADICPTHKIAITKRQAGKCVYADPCGCRLYQGTVPKHKRR